jgi:hypothetical protein
MNDVSSRLQVGGECLANLRRSIKAAGCAILFVYTMGAWACAPAKAGTDADAEQVFPLIQQSTTPDLAELVHKAFAGIFEIDTGTVSPHYLVADLTGNGRLDLAVMGRSVTVPRGDEPAVKIYIPSSADLDPLPPITWEEYGEYRGVGSLSLLVIHDYTAAADAAREAFVLGRIRWHLVGMRLFEGPIPLASIADDVPLFGPPALVGKAILLHHDNGDGDILYWDGELYRLYPFYHKTAEPVLR